MLSLFAFLAKRKQFVVIVTPCPLLLLCAILNVHNECLKRPLKWVPTPFLSKPLEHLFSQGFYICSTILCCFVMLLFFTFLPLDQLTVEGHFTHLIMTRLTEYESTEEGHLDSRQLFCHYNSSQTCA